MQSNVSQLIPILAKCNSLLFDFDGTLAPNLDLPDMRKQVIVMCDAYQIPDVVYSGLYIVEVIEAAKKHLENTDPESVLDGEINEFLEAALYNNKSKKNK